jgi:hypothetical protein
MDWTSVPKASVDEDSHFCWPEYDIRPAPEIGIGFAV